MFHTAGNKHEFLACFSSDNGMNNFDALKFSFHSSMLLTKPFLHFEENHKKTEKKGKKVHKEINQGEKEK